MNSGVFGFPSANQGKLLREIVAGDFTLVPSSQIVVAHGFESLPFVQCQAVCVGAQAGWQPGDIVLLGTSAHDAAAAGTGIQICYGAGQVRLSAPAGAIGNLVSKTAPAAPVPMAAGLWRLRVRMIG